MTGSPQADPERGRATSTTWDHQRIDDVVEGYRQVHCLSQGDRVARAGLEQHWWAWEVVTDGAMDGTLPMEVLDALVHHPQADRGFRGYVAAGPVEDALAYQVATYGAAIAERCARDAVWAETVVGVWLDHGA